MTDQNSSEQSAEKKKDSPGKSMYVLLSILLSVNVLFLLFIVSRFPEDRTVSLEDIKAQISNKKNGYEIEMHLSRYILLKMQIQNSIRENRDTESIQKNIDQAIIELEAVLSIPELKTALDETKRADIENELQDMKKARVSFTENSN